MEIGILSLLLMVMVGVSAPRTSAAKRKRQDAKMESAWNFFMAERRLPEKRSGRNVNDATMARTRSLGLVELEGDVDFEGVAVAEAGGERVDLQHALGGSHHGLIHRRITRGV